MEHTRKDQVSIKHTQTDSALKCNSERRCLKVLTLKESKKKQWTVLLIKTSCTCKLPVYMWKGLNLQS